MEDEVEDIVGDVKYTDSQKSVTTSAVYSLDFTDSSSDKNNSSGKDTYVIESDSDDSDKTFQVHKSESIINLIDKGVVKHASEDIPKHSISTSVSTSLPICNIIAQEIFTQTSKTIIELAQNEINKLPDCNTLQTQTSFVSVIENKSVEYKIRIVGTNNNCNGSEIKDKVHIDQALFKNNVQNAISKFEQNTSVISKSEIESITDGKTSHNSDEDVIHFIDDESRNDSGNKNLSNEQENTSEYESTNYDSDVDNDSLMENEYCENRTKSRDETSETNEVLDTIDSDVEELYNRLSESPKVLTSIISTEPAIRNFGILTPLTEETAQKKDSILDLTPSVQTLTKASEFNSNNTLFVSSSGVRVTILSDTETGESRDFKFPPIYKNPSWPNNSDLNFLFTLNNHKSNANACMLPSLYKRQEEKNFDRWEIGTKELASGESPHISARRGHPKISKDHFHLPSIHLEGMSNNGNNSVNYLQNYTPSCKQSSVDDYSCDTISIQGKIKELKMNARRMRPKYSSRSGSPTSVGSPDESRACDAAEKGCDLLCVELLRRLRSPSWVEITETLEDLPKALDKFWGIITENRIADLLRQVTSHIDSPRTQVARAACKTLADILKNTNYTKKPEFYECVSTLLARTGSYNRPVRREANLALDRVVCHADVTPCVTAVCVHGVSHKSVLVRCAAARLLVVCCALAAGGRHLLRTRPPSAAAARRHALRALAELLQDKNADSRKYAERLYAMLRPLPNFEAFFLTDVDVDLASRHMKKYDQLLNSTAAKTR